MNTSHQQPLRTNNSHDNHSDNNNRQNRDNNNNNTEINQAQGLTEQRIHQIFRELNCLQTQQAGLLQELQDLTDGTDPPGIDWIYPDPNPETQHSR